MSQNFAEVAGKNGVEADQPTNWRCLTISFDPEKDTPAVLKAYGERHGYDPKHWSLLTGDLDGDHAFEQFGEMFWRDSGND